MNEALPIQADICPEVNFTDKERNHFWSKVQKSNDCWLWQGGKPGRKYGQYFLRQKRVGTHRVAWMMSRNRGIPQGMFICHHCDNPQCVRPEHLFLGTAQDNSDDKCKKGRQAKGDTQGLRKHPGTAARGLRHGWHTHPESVPRGDNHHSRKRPERMARGEGHGLAKFTNDDILEIRQLRKDGMLLRLIAERFKCSRPCIGFIIKGRTWSHVE